MEALELAEQVYLITPFKELSSLLREPPQIYI